MAVVLSAALLSACAGGTSNVTEMALFPSKSLVEDIASPEMHLRLDVGVLEFDENYTLEQAKEHDVYPEVRKAEARYFAVRLRDKIRAREYWRSVWVVPGSAVTDIKVGGRIIRSDGKYLELAVKAVDASGKVLLQKTYEEEASQFDYSADREPFDNLFQEISDDLIREVADMDKQDVVRLQRAADLRFAQWLAPDVFARSDERPPRGGEVYQQTVRLREYDALFFDKLQDYYDQFNIQVKEPHTKWSHESYLEIAAKEEAQSEATKQAIGGTLLLLLGVATAVAGSNSSNYGTQDAALLAGTAAAVGGGAVMYDAHQKYKRSEIHDEALRELGAALEGEVRPYTMDLEDETVQLDGSVKEQYLQWQKVLKRHHRALSSRDS